MIKGLYTAAAGMMVQMAKQDVVANNIANVNTNGYKKDNVLCQSFPSMLISRLGESQYDAKGQEKMLPPVVIGSVGTGAAVKEIVTDHTAGAIKYTGNLTDFAITNKSYFIGNNVENGEQLLTESYFVVQTPQGERFTRDGAFKINQEGILVNNQGYPVMSTDDEVISVLNEDGQVAEDFAIDASGSVLIDGNEIAKLKIVCFENQKNLEKEGGFMKAKVEGQYTLAENPGIQQGYLEMSNANAIQEMVNLISVVRAYESCQKVVQAEDELMSVAIDQVGSSS